MAIATSSIKHSNLYHYVIRYFEVRDLYAHIKLFGVILLTLFCNITAYYTTVDDAMDIKHFITHRVNHIKLFWSKFT